MGFPILDFILTVLAYLYVFGTILLASWLKKSNRISGTSARKFVHVAIGMLVIIAPLFFNIRIIPTYIGCSFIVITFLTSPVSPFPRLRLSAFRDGHQLGTVYYSISLTILLYLFIDLAWVIQAGFLPVVVGDALASVIGKKYGKHRWLADGKKTIEGSIAGLISSILIVFFALLLYYYLDLFSSSLSLIIILSLLEGITMAIVELVSPLGLDNLSIPFACTVMAIVIGPVTFDMIILIK